MAVVFNTLFARLGRLADFGVAIRAHQSTLRTEFEDTMSNYTDATRDLVKRLTSNIETRIDEAGNLMQDIVGDAGETIIEMMDDDTSLERYTVRDAVAELIRQMRDAGTPETVSRPSSGYVTLPASNKGTAAAGNTGDGIFLLSDMAPLGEVNDTATIQDSPNIQSETITARCVRDSNSQDTPEGRESFQIVGQRAVSRLDEDWPSGTGTRTRIQVATASVDGGRSAGVNVCTNSDFESFTTTNVPDNWTIATGTAGTHVFKSTGLKFRGSSALRLVGDGSTAHNLTQALRSTTGTLGGINPDRPYTISAAVRVGSIGTLPGVSLVISVRDSGGTILHDSIIGRAMQLSIGSGDLTASFQQFSAVVFSPVSVQKGAYIDIRFSGNVTNTSNVYVDDIVIAEMHQASRTGLGFQVIQGATDYRVRDEFTASVTNNISGANGGRLAQEFDRMFDMNRLGLVLPADTTGSETQSDSLIS